MKARIIALLLLLALLLTACSSASSDLTKSGKEPRDMHHSDDAEGIPDVDIGVVDGNTYRHVDLGFSVTFPEDWTLGESSSVMVKANGEIESVDLDRAEVLDAVNAGDDVSIFIAHDANRVGYELYTIVKLSVSLNPLPDADPDGDALVNHFSPLLKQEYAQRDAYSLLASEPFDADFCGEEHVVLNLTFGNAEPEFYETKLYLPCGKLLYTLTVACDREGGSLEILNLFEPLG